MSVRYVAKEHDLKCWPEFFEQVQDGRKPFEIRYNDRDYAVGDLLRIHEYRPGKGHDEGEYTGREVERRVTYLTDFMQWPKWVVLGLGEAK